MTHSEKYIAPEIEVLGLQEEQVICASAPGNGGLEGIDYEIW